MTVLGVDGCRNGWCVASITNDKIAIDIYSSVHEIVKYHSSTNDILIDIPIGLGDRNVERDLDLKARKHLSKGNQSSIFSPPVRESLLANDYDSAKNINQEVTGKKISIQTWNICNKIREIDGFITQGHEYLPIFKEAHPEICFKYLNYGHSPEYKKRAPQNRGIEERLSILEKFEAGIHYAYHLARKQYQKSTVANDDIVDALCLMITARLGSTKGYSTIKGMNTYDSMGIDMKMYYYYPQSN